MALLDLIQNVCGEHKLPVPTAVIGSTDKTAITLLAQLRKECQYMASKYAWPQLNREWTITLVAGQAAYALPEDLDYQISETQWSRSDNWRISGPLSPERWQQYQAALITSSPWQRYRVKGMATNQFFVDPVPTADDAGKTLVFEYQSLTCWRPRIWQASLTFLAGAYCFYNGNIYKTTTGGVTGATPPTHTTSSVSDGGVIWTYTSAPYDAPTADTDVPLLRQSCLEAGTKWRYLETNRLPYGNHKREADDLWESQVTALQGAETLDLSGGAEDGLGPVNIPDTGYGGI